MKWDTEDQPLPLGVVIERCWHCYHQLDLTTMTQAECCRCGAPL